MNHEPSNSRPEQFDPELTAEGLESKAMNGFYILGSLLTALCLLLSTSCAGRTIKTLRDGGTESRGKIVLFPFDNFTDNKNAVINVMPDLKSLLERKGYEVLDWDSVEGFLCEQRVRATGYVSRDLALKIKDEFAANAILVGSVVLFRSGGDPGLGLSARLIDTSSGAILWADYASATGYDFAGILELGRIRTMYKLIPRVVQELFASFSTEPPYKEIESAYKIAVMPFKNTTAFRNGGMIVTYMFLDELLKNRKFVPVEYGGIRKTMIEKRIRYKGELNFKNIKALKETLGVDSILVGTVERYSAGSIPGVAVTARLLDAGKNRILWYKRQQLDGDEGIIVFDWGKLRTADKVAHKVVSKLVDKMADTEWN